MERETEERGGTATTIPAQPTRNQRSPALIVEDEHDPAGEVLAPGAIVGRFIVHRTLGMGGAGVVYAAHDPELDRTIALKLLRRELSHRGDARARFVREAQALARVSHPNVISVYDVGSASGRAFIAMEYIHGQTFADWLATSDRAWSEIMTVLLRAGRGLAAAHAAGVIHRDFKPGNLLVGADGRVVVTDFGLARAIAEVDPEDHAADARRDRSRSSALDRSITRTGSVQGTPAYMAPEQQQGLPADARADQFSFCVTVHEALFREHPFLASPSPTSSTVAAIVERSAIPAPRAGDPGAARAPRDVRGVPLWLQRAIQRGLSRRPEDRHPTMDSLLTALNREPLRRRRRARLALTAVAAALAGSGFTARCASVGDDAEICIGGREQLSGVWSPALATRVRAAFVATGRPHARSSAARVEERLDTYAGQWAEMHRAACLATARGEQSAELLDRRMACLSRRLSQVGALLDLFIRRADAGLVDGAIELVGDLEPVAACGDAAALLSRVAPPGDPARRARVTELEGRADRAELERQAGRPEAAASAARAVLEAEGALDHSPLAAQAGRTLGRALEDLGRPAEAREALLAAQRDAERAGDASLAMHLMLDLLVVTGVREERYAEARLLGQIAEVALERPALRGDEALRARLLAALGGVATQERQIDRAIELHREVLAIRRRVLPEVSEDVASAEDSLGVALRDMADQDAARPHHLEALRIRRHLFGDEHPLTASAHINLGVTYLDEANTDEARKHLLKALAILERMPEYRTYPNLLNNLGMLERIAGNHDRALRYHEATLAVRLRQLDPEHPYVALSVCGVGTSHRDVGDASKALTFQRRALAIYEKRAGKDHPRYAHCLSEMGETLRQLGRAAESLQHQERALTIIQARHSNWDSRTQLYRGLALLDLGRRREAASALERAREEFSRVGLDGARASFALARALEPRRPRSARARALAREALDIFTDLGAAGARDEVAAYLALATR